MLINAKRNLYFIAYTLWLNSEYVNILILIIKYLYWENMFWPIDRYTMVGPILRNGVVQIKPNEPRRRS